MKLNDILDCLSQWEQLIHDKAKNYSKLKKLISDVNYFKFKIHYTEKSAFIHAYPGIHKGKLQLFLLAEEFDNMASKNQIEDNIQISEVEHFTLLNTLEGTIPQGEALKRVKNWTKDCKAWIPKQAHCKSGFLKCYLIPVDDIQQEKGNETIAYFALKNEKDAVGFAADLILMDDDGSSLENAATYYDTVKLVPPFPPKTEMYLLAAAAETDVLD